MLFATQYPDYQDPIGDVHERRPHIIFDGVQKICVYAGNVFATLFVVAFTGMELMFVLALATLAVQGWQDQSARSVLREGELQLWQTTPE